MGPPFGGPRKATPGAPQSHPGHVRGRRSLVGLSYRASGVHFVSIMAFAHRVAGVLASLLLLNGAGATEMAPPNTYNPLPSGYSLSYDKDKWTEGFSVFHMAVADTYGVVGSSFAASDDPRLKPLTRLDSSWKLTAPLLGLPMRLGDG